MAERWPALLTQEDALEYLQIGESKFKELRALGLIRSVLVGSERIVRFRRSDLDRFVDELPDGSGRPCDKRLRDLVRGN